MVDGGVGQSHQRMGVLVIPCVTLLLEVHIHLRLRVSACLFEAEPFEPAHDGLDNPVRNVLLWVARRTARNSVEFTDTDQ